MISPEYNMKIVIVSNDNYGEGLDQLHGANYIAEQLYNYFKLITIEPKNDIMLLQDIKYTEAVNKLYEFINNITQDNCVFLFYFCGHRKISSNNISDLIMAFKDTTSNNFDSVGLRFNDLVNKVKIAKINRFICIVDSCCSGIINSTMGDNDLIFNEDICDDGTVYISSGKGSLPAYETTIGNLIVPCFSYCFWKVLTDRNKNDMSLYSIEELFCKTQRFVIEIEKRMQPQITRKNSLYTKKLFPNINNCDDFNMILDVIDWRITSQCDNKCGVCYACNDTQEITDLSEEQIDIIIEKLSHINCKSICVSGGEPTQSRFFEKIMRELYQNGFSIFLSTNGSKYMEYHDEIEQYIEKLSLPLDGYDETSNRCNGRNEMSFTNVKEILEYYKVNKHNFPIKISTVLTHQNDNIDHLSQILNLIKDYDIKIWKIYEFIPENRGVKNRSSFTISNTKKRKIQNWINRIKDNYRFKIEYISRAKRNAAYFIIQSNGEVIIPIENNGDKIVIEKKVGNIVSDNFINIMKTWSSYVDEDNYISNVKLRKLGQLFYLKPYEKNILHTLLSKKSIPSLNDISKTLNEKADDIEAQVNKLYENRIIKKILPIVNLKIYGINTYLVNITFSQNLHCPDGYLEDYLCYNAHIGWVTKCQNNIFRIAIFGKEQMDAIKICEEIQNCLDKNMQYDIHELRCSYAIGEDKIFINSSTDSSISVNSTKYNSNDQKISYTKELTYDEFYTLKELENLRKPLKENVDNKTFFNSQINFNNNIISLQEKGIIEKISVILDTRLLGYNWYVVFVRISNNRIEELINFLKTQYNNITHINSLIPTSSEWNLDFEIHTISFAEVNEVIEEIEKRFDAVIKDTPLKIIKECKFSFLTHYVSDIIIKNYIIKKDEGDHYD